MAVRLDSLGRVISKKKIYPLEFKLRALQALEEKPLQEVMNDFGIPSPQTLHHWRKTRERLLEQAELRQSSKRFYRSQVTLLKRAVRRVTMERNILKKAVSYFARQRLRSANTYSSAAQKRR